MSTPSGIGIMHPNKSVEIVYCHFDGDPKLGVGVNLIKYFNSLEMAQEIVSSGWRDCLVKSPPYEVTFYGDEALFFENWDEVLKWVKKRPDIFYVYVWDDICWKFIEAGQTEPQNLEQFLKSGESR
jgi:hypothetical protein